MFYYNDESEVSDFINQITYDHEFDVNKIVNHFEVFDAQSVLRQLIHQALGGLLGKKPFDSMVSDSFKDIQASDWRVYRNKYNSLSIKQIEGENVSKLDEIYLFPNDIFLYFTGPGEATITKYVFSPPPEIDVFTKSRPLLSRDTFRVSNGSYIYLKAGSCAIEFNKISSLLFFEVASIKHDPVVWHYHKSKKIFVRLSSANVPATRKVFSMDILKKIKSRASINVLKKVAINDKHHFVRWKAVETLGVIAPSEVEDVVKLLLEDSHPEIRQSAEQSLLSISQMQGE